MKKIFYAFIALFAISSCNEGTEKPETDQVLETPEETTLDFYGETFDPTGAIAVDEMVQKMEGQETGNFVIKTKINETCAKMGCWMSVDKTDGEMMVYMKDHEFFVPKGEAAGLDCFVSGTAFVDTMTVEWQKHLLEDANAPQEEIDAITEIKTQISFTANGVIIDGYTGTEKGHNHEGHDHSHEGHDHEGHDHEGHDHEGHDHEGTNEEPVKKMAQ